MSSSLPSFPKLGHTNYNSWAGDMEAWFRSQGLWRLVSGSSPRPGEYEAALDSWETKADRAAG
ncbi:hypothetical protein FA15DRAFT_606437 [Coprinopsis marcescibilis]|uniref:DUF4219 domain-containing protein n=1 Tax=Coprinopsis marcescibilis TaxID=230819 RepID=A0A5C3K9Z8_COPMA|nr:hypothetical protein FA15DRAFT_606437 [Coprinopsis marcescibilis]